MCGVRKEGGLSGGWFGESRVVTAGRESVPGCSRQVMPADRLDVQGWTIEGLPEGETDCYAGRESTREERVTHTKRKVLRRRGSWRIVRQIVIELWFGPKKRDAPWKGDST